MGMDVYGNNPKTEAGEYFRANVWYWHPLADYACFIAPNITQHCQYWHSNDYDGLDDQEAVALSLKIQETIDNGSAASYIRAYENKRKLEEAAGDRFTYPMSMKTLQEFATFLRECGGFKIA